MEDKIKLEEELEFLKESFEAEVITMGEYENTKARIENRLKEIETKEKTEEVQKTLEGSEEKKEEPENKESTEKEEMPGEKKEELKEEKPAGEAEEQKPIEDYEEKEDKIEIKELREPKKVREVEKEGVKTEDIKNEGGFKEIVVDEKEEDTNDILNSSKEINIEKAGKKISRWVPIAAFMFLIIIGYFSFVFFTNGESIETAEKIEEILPACFSDKDCVEEGMISFCINPGSKDAECEFKEDARVGLTVLNTPDCFNCDTARVEKIIKKWFPGVVKSELDSGSEEGELMVKELGIEQLPAFVFDSSLESAFKYEELRVIFSEVDGNYILSPMASGSTFYINKEEVPNKLDVFLMEGDSSTKKAEENIEEFLDLFEGKIDYGRHLVGKEDELVKNLGINTFPTFIVNDKIRFSGVQPAEIIKQNFCKLNELEECSEKLGERLV